MAKDVTVGEGGREGGRDIVACLEQRTMNRLIE